MTPLKSFIGSPFKHLKLFFEKAPCSDEQMLLNDLNDTRERIEQCRLKFDLTSDDDLTDACIFELQALTSRYRYLLKQAKEKRLRCTFTGEYDIERTG